MHTNPPLGSHNLAQRAAAASARLQSADAAWRTLREDAARTMLSAEAIRRQFRTWLPSDSRSYHLPSIGKDMGFALSLVVDSLLFKPNRAGSTPLRRYLERHRASPPLPLDPDATRVLWGFVFDTPAGLPPAAHLVMDAARIRQTVVWSIDALPPTNFPVAVRVLPDPLEADLMLALTPPVPLDFTGLEAAASLHGDGGTPPEKLEALLLSVYRRTLAQVPASLMDLAASLSDHRLPGTDDAASDDPAMPDQPADSREIGRPLSARDEIPRLQPSVVLALDRVALDWAQRDPDGADLALARGLASADGALRALAHATSCGRHGPATLERSWDRLAQIFVETLAARHAAGIADCGLAPAQLLGMIRDAYPEGAMRDGMTARLTAIRAAMGPSVERTARTDPSATDRLLARIRALQARTIARGCSEQEAGVAARQLGRLMERHADLLGAEGLPDQGFRALSISLPGRRPSALLRARGAIAAFVDCRAWADHDENGRLVAVYFGLHADVAAAAALHHLVATTLSTELDRFKACHELKGAPPARRNRATRDFAAGLVTRIGDRLVSMKQARRAERLRSRGRDLVERKLALIDAELERLGLSFTDDDEDMRILDRRAFMQGMIAGEGFDPHAGSGRAPGPSRLSPPRNGPPAASG